MTINTAVFDSFPILKTDRLTLRDIRLEDAEAIFKMRASGHVNRFMARHTMTEMEAAEALVQKTRDAYDNQKAIGFAGILRDKKEIIGTCGLTNFDAPNLRAELGGELSVHYWGKKIAIEAVSTILDFGLNTVNLHAIESWIEPGNRGAIAVMERLGFVKEAHFRDKQFFKGEFRDMTVYTLFKGNEKLL